MLAVPAMLCWLQRWVEHSDGMRVAHYLLACRDSLLGAALHSGRSRVLFPGLVERKA